MSGFRDEKKTESYPLRYNQDFFSSRKFEEQPKIRFFGREWFYLASLSVIGYLASLITDAQAIPNDFQGWAVTSAHVALDKTRTHQIYLEAQPRVGDDWQRATTFQGRVAFNYNIDRSIRLHAGYAWTPALINSQGHRDYRDEQRLWQQLLYAHESVGIQWQHRIRQEQRFIMRTDGISHRSRYLLRASYPLSEDKNMGATAFDEVMVNLNSTVGGPSGGYDRNRIFIGPFWQLGNARFEVGYIGEHIKRFGDDSRWTHAIAVFTSFDL